MDKRRMRGVQLVAGAATSHLLKAGLQAARGHRVLASSLTEEHFRPIRDCCEKQKRSEMRILVFGVGTQKEVSRQRFPLSIPTGLSSL